MAADVRRLARGGGSELLRRTAHALLAWLVGAALAYLLASVAHTQTVLYALASLDVHVGWIDRLRTTLGDLIGLWPYGIVVGLSLGLGLIVMQALSRWLVPVPAFARGLLAGTLAVASALIAMRLAFSITPIASARGTGGFALQCAAGGAGGLAFFACLKRTAAARTEPG